MPKCLIHAVRDYKSGKYAGGIAYDPFVMTTRSGLSINTVPRGSKFTSLRRISSVGSTTSDDGKLSVKKKPIQSVSRSLHCLSFVTRFYIGRRLPSLDLTAIASKEFVHWKEELLSLWEMKRADGEEENDARTSEQSTDYHDNVMESLWKGANSLSKSDSGIGMKESKYRLSHLSPSCTEADDSCTSFGLVKKESHLGYQQLFCSSEPGLPVVEVNSLPNAAARRFVASNILAPASITSSPRLPVATGITSFLTVTTGNQSESDMIESSRRKRGCTKFYDNNQKEGSVGEGDLKFSANDTELQSKSACKQLTWTNGNNRNACNICGKIFSRSWLLKGHVRTHTGERPFRCTFPNCDKAFADKSNLRSHLLIHKTERKTYTCPKCSRSFAQKRYLHKHMQEVCRML